MATNPRSLTHRTEAVAGITLNDDERSGARLQSPLVRLADDRDWPRVTVIIPAMNEARNLEEVLPELPPWIHEVILVDGRSSDDTIEVARRMVPDCRVLTQPGKGKGDALVHGFAHARGDIIVTLDADGSADPGEIHLFVAALMGGADYTKGSRHAVGGGSADLTRTRRWGNKLLGAVVNTLFRTRYTDLCYGYNAFWAHALPALAIDCDGFEVETLMNVRAIKAGLKVAEVPSCERHRIHGMSNLSATRDGLRVLRTILHERLTPHRPAPMPSVSVAAADRDLVAQMSESGA